MNNRKAREEHRQPAKRVIRGAGTAVDITTLATMMPALKEGKGHIARDAVVALHVWNELHFGHRQSRRRALFMIGLVCRLSCTPRPVTPATGRVCPEWPMTDDGPMMTWQPITDR